LSHYESQPNLYSMKNFVLVVALASCTLFCLAQQATVKSSFSEIRGPFVWNSKIYPGTQREYWIYVPKQYDATKPTCVMVVQDGLSRATGWNLPAVLDSLIAAKTIPVMIGIFIDHGKVPASSNDAYPRFNRSLEYDGLGDRYARFLLEEMLPEVSRSYNLSSDPNDRSIAGASSGAICAFNVAWERPDAFRRVFSTIGTYVGLRGGDELATLVRKTEPKPLRVFLQDGNHDLNIYAGDWWMANQNTLSALTWAGYEVNHAWGEGGHDSKHSATILADALTWLWKDYPAPVQAHKVTAPRVNLLLENEPWVEVPIGNIKINKLAVNKNGELYFSAGEITYKAKNSGSPTQYAAIKGGVAGISFHEDGRMYAADIRQHKIIALDGEGAGQTIISGVDANTLTISTKGIYFTDATKPRIGFYDFEKKQVRYVETPGKAVGLAINAEQTFINVAVDNNVFGYSFKIMNDGALAYGQEYVHYHIPYGSATPNAKGMTVDADNLLYTATAMGIQVSDQLGRVNLIFSKPFDEPVDVKLGGAEFSVLYVSANGKLFSRKIAAKGILPWLPAVKPPKPGL
jgi:gluconolactonase